MSSVMLAVTSVTQDVALEKEAAIRAALEYFKMMDVDKNGASKIYGYMEGISE